jgi:hypothetical protein
MIFTPSTIVVFKIVMEVVRSKIGTKIGLTQPKQQTSICWDIASPQSEWNPERILRLKKPVHVTCQAVA